MTRYELARRRNLLLLGDVMYGGEVFNCIRLLALHAATLQLKHPISGFPALTLRAPLPDSECTRRGDAVAAERVLAVPLGEGPLWTGRGDMMA